MDLTKTKYSQFKKVELNKDESKEVEETLVKNKNSQMF